MTADAQHERQRQYDRARREAARRNIPASLRAAVRIVENRRSARKRKKGQVERRIVGVDGEGHDFYVCRKCKEKTSSAGGACSRGGDHAITYACRACGVRGACSRERCPATPNGRHELEASADGHDYVYIAAVDEHGRLVAEAENRNGLTHEECVGMLLAIPRSTLKFGFMFSYDVTKICEEMPSEALYYLLRPGTREGAVCKDKECKADLPRGATECGECGGTKIRKATKPLEWNGRSYDFFNGSLSVSESREGQERSTKVWDCFRFFGCAFVEALKSWSGCKTRDCKGLMRRSPKGWACGKCSHEVVDYGLETPVATEEQIARVEGMKSKRGAFDTEDPEAVKRYCREECHLLARMMRRLIDAHDRAGIPLKRYDGAGSTATALLRKYKVSEHKGPRLAELEPELAYAVACSFFGGRFEDSVVGTVAAPVHGFDISSAYPFALTTLPCLTCGSWRYERRMTPSKLAAIQARGGLVLCRFHVRHVTAEERREISWCPLPFRSEEGSISYGTNFSGWSWGQEVAAAVRGWPDLVRLDGAAWIYETPCYHGEKGYEKHRPFEFLPEIYRQRNAWGKEGAGIVLKLGMNACVTGDTLVRTALGDERIDALVGSAVEVVGADGELHTAGVVFRVGWRDVYKLRTRGGLELRLTPGHLVLTKNRGDVRAWELTVDDLIETARGTDQLESFVEDGRAVVYDLTEVDTLHFIANGIVIHNSYGKTAQSIGDDPPFQSWVWAGACTATTRGQLLDAIASAKDRWNVLAVATDGIFALEELPLKAPPHSVGTDDMEKPLGGWEHKHIPGGIFLAKPGLYYSLNPEEKGAFVRARGIGRREVSQARDLLVEGFAQWDRRDMDYGVVLRSRRFYGAKHSILGRTGCIPCEQTWPGVPEQQNCKKCNRAPTSFKTTMAQTEDGRRAYGTWDVRKVKIAFDPHPKRERSGISRRGQYARLRIRDLGGHESAPYAIGAGKTTPEGELARAAQQFELEQPDWNG